MKYLVTGGAGFIGSHITDLLIQEHHEVVILDNLFSGKRENISHLIEKNGMVHFINGSITDPAILKSACESVDGIFHEAAIASVARSVNNPIATNEANVAGTLNVLTAARDAGVKKVVFAPHRSMGIRRHSRKKSRCAPARNRLMLYPNMPGKNTCRSSRNSMD